MSHSAQDRYRRLTGGCLAALAIALLALAASGWMVTPARAEPRAQPSTPEPPSSPITIVISSLATSFVTATP